MTCPHGVSMVSKVLLLTASLGDGHNQAARAIQEVLERQSITARVIDYMEWLHPAVRSFAKFTLLQGVQKTPALYGLFYRSTLRIRPDSSLQRRLNHWGIAHMKRTLKSFNPDLVVGTFPVPLGLMSELRAEGHSKIPTMAIVTDYTAHPQWIHDHTDMYCVASDTVRREFLAYGLSPEKIKVTGIPVRSKFNDVEVRRLLDRRNETRKKLGVPVDAPLVLLMTGGAGILSDVSGWEQIIQRTKAQFCVICGRNERLYRRLRPLQSDRVRVLGFTENINEWMSISDLGISKAGGLTVTEALAMELPMLLYRPIPGQERRNARFMIQTGAAIHADDEKSAERILASLVQDLERLTRMRAAARAQHISDGAQHIAEAIGSALVTRSLVSTRNGIADESILHLH